MKTPAGFPSPALVATGKSSTGSIALASFVSGFVAVEAALQPKGSPGSRDVAAVAALAKGALAHLRTVERKAG
jgi:hypothetical protein